MIPVRKLKSLKCLIALLFSAFFIFCLIIPDSLLSKIWTNIIFDRDTVNRICNVSTELKGREWKYPEGPKADAEPEEKFKYQNISNCLCSRRWMYPPTIDMDGDAQIIKSGSKRLTSSCSDEGTHYQNNQNVISFSLFYPEKSSESQYTSFKNLQRGLLQNLLMIRKHYPGYSIRVYTSICPTEYFCNILCENEDVFWCDIRKTPSHGDLSWTDFRTWRFLPLGDPTVNIFHIRDLDSIISHREAAAAQDWLSNTKKAIMLMRDCKGNHNTEILGGMWGADNRRLLGEGGKLRQKLISKSNWLKSKQDWGSDQTFLAGVIFYPMAKHIVAYDSYHCVGWSEYTEVRPFPVRQRNPETDFVGNYVRFSVNGTEPKNYEAFECPLECRPSYGLDWIYC